MAVAAIPQPQSGASLLLSFSTPWPATTSPRFSSLLLISPTRLSAVRAFAALEAGYTVYVAAGASDVWDAELLTRRTSGQVTPIDFDLGSTASEKDWGTWLDALPSEVRSSCMFVVLNDTLPPLPSATSTSTRRSYPSALAFRQAANARRFLVNVADAPLLSDFSWPSSHRFALSTSTLSPDANAKSPLQIAVTTNSSACRLASRLRREIVASLPENVGAGVLAVSALRQELADSSTVKGWNEDAGEVEVSGVGLNTPVDQLSVERSERLAKVAVPGRSEEQTEEHDKRELSPCRARRASRSAVGEP